MGIKHDMTNILTHPNGVHISKHLSITLVSNLPHEVLLPNFLLRYLTVRRVRLSVDAVDTTSESLGGARWGPSAGGGLRPGPVAAGRECVPAASYAPVGPFSRPVVAGPAGAVCPRWRVARVTPGDRVRCIGGQPIAATLLVASKISLRLLWWPQTEHHDQCALIYRCVFTHVCCWLFSVGNKVTTTTITSSYQRLHSRSIMLMMDKHWINVDCWYWYEKCTTNAQTCWSGTIFFREIHIYVSL